MRRAYRADGRSAPLWFVRVMLVLAFPVIIAWTYLYVLIRDIGRSFYAAWLDARIEIANARRIWNGGDVL